MTTITLHTAALDNGGMRREAGAQLVVGSDRHEIAADRAKALVADGSAVSVSSVVAKPVRKAKGAA